LPNAPVDAAAQVTPALAVLLARAKLGGHLAERLGQPAVLGELGRARRDLIVPRSLQRKTCRLCNSSKAALQ